jgi:peptidoglycan/xylan/chitin deacetylase (PgdA/CDA1 family)
VNTGIVNKPAVKNVAELIELCKSLNIEERQLLFSEIKKHLPDKDYRTTYTPEFWRLMNPQQLKELAHAGLIEIGAHSHSHPNLGLIDLAHAEKEIQESKTVLEKAIQKEVKSMAFPDGSYTEEVKQLCYKAGYTNLLAVDYRCSSDGSDHHILPRYCISSTTTYESNIIQVNRHFASYGF